MFVLCSALHNFLTAMGWFVSVWCFQLTLSTQWGLFVALAHVRAPEELSILFAGPCHYAAVLFCTSLYIRTQLSRDFERSRLVMGVISCACHLGAASLEGLAECIVG